MPSIEPASPRDPFAILDLLTRCDLISAGLSDHLDTTLVGWENGKVVGCAALEVYEDGALLRSVAVDKQQRGRGLGKRLTEAALALALEQHITDIYLLTMTAEDFFERFFGFRPITRAEVPASVKTSVEFVSACPESALVMARSLDGDRM
jgi:amino-acid N-acetyltransferase